MAAGRSQPGSQAQLLALGMQLWRVACQAGDASAAGGQQACLPASVRRLARLQFSPT